MPRTHKQMITYILNIFIYCAFYWNINSHWKMMTLVYWFKYRPNLGLFVHSCNLLICTYFVIFVLCIYLSFKIFNILYFILWLHAYVAKSSEQLLFRYISTVKKYFRLSIAMGDKERVLIVKDEQKHSPPYHPVSLYADNMYPPTTHLNAEHLRIGDERHRQYDVPRQYHWMSTDAGDSVMDCSKGKAH